MTRPSDDELLENAIPIDQVQDEADDEADLIPIEDEPETIDVAASSSDTMSKITAFGGNETRHEDNWNRTPNANGTGAIHVRTFVTKLRLDAMAHLDKQVNEWLDAHPQYEVKFVTTTIGKLTGKVTEDAIFMNVWV